ncbi:hypothetical protein [Aestuariibacter sp. A3R04]|uniref:hypothetical protein n=1 Tax=Aestuariibacter sp. A3R04 TaxID=2841571 RepID=UPI001C08DCD6|nr:hypothetical protein [Aestuariibacter sp. A3R04]MBU3023444.1 hypothetical protein [Aestuariibacter sp. A3R04]
MRSLFKRVFTLFAVLTIFSANLVSAQDTVLAVLFNEPVTEADVSPDPAQLNTLAKALGVSREMAMAHFQHGKLTELIVDKVLADYATSRNISPDPALVARFIEVFGESLNTQKAKEAKARAEAKANDDALPMPKSTVQKSIQTIAEEQVKRWLIDKSLYNEFGGTVIFRSNTPQYPVGAYYALLQQYAKQGKLVIKEDAFAGLFWKGFSAPYTAVIEPQSVDFSYPWWY